MFPSITHYKYMKPLPTWQDPGLAEQVKRDFIMLYSSHLISQKVYQELWLWCLSEHSVHGYVEISWWGSKWWSWTVNVLGSDVCSMYSVPRVKSRLFVIVEANQNLHRNIVTRYVNVSGTLRIANFMRYIALHTWNWNCC